MRSQVQSTIFGNSQKVETGLPYGPVVKHLPADAGDTGSIPGRGRSHIPWSNEVRVPHVLKPARLEPMLHRRSHCDEKPAPATAEQPPSPKREQACVQQQRSNAAKKKKNFIEKKNCFLKGGNNLTVHQQMDDTQNAVCT